MIGRLETSIIRQDRDAEVLRRAVRLACDSVSTGGGPFGAVVMLNGELIAEGVNRVVVWNDPTAHAEVVAIRAACKKLGRFDLRECELVSSCEPCPMCLAAAHWARFQRIIFTATRYQAAEAGFDDALLYDQFALPESDRVVPIQLIKTDEATAPFEAWGRMRERIAY